MRVLSLAIAVASAVSSVVVVDAKIKRILHFSDVHLNISASFDAAESAAMPFHYGADAPIALLESALDYAKRVLPNPDFVLYTGDHAAHGQFSDDYIKHAVDTNVRTFEKYFPVDSQKRLEVTAVIGNADGSPDYYMDVTNPNKAANPSIELISQVWNSSLSKSNFDSFNRRGYLSYDLDAKLAVLTLNTVPYSPSHTPDTSANSDPFHQFAWLNATLLQLRQNERFAYIAGHIAPFIDSYGGQPQWHEHYIKSYKAIVSSYADVIKAQFFGHVHSVEFRVPVGLADDDDALQQVPLFVTGSVSPLFGNNPSFMVWEYDAETYEVVDFIVHGTNISNTAPQLAWKPLFRARKAYNIESLSSTALEELALRMQADPALLEDYYWNMKAQSYRLPPCDHAACRAQILCTMKWWSTRGEYLACVNSVRFSYSVMTRIGTSAGAPMPVSHVAMAIGGTVVASAAIMAVVVVVLFGLKYSGIIKSADARERDYEDVFPML